MRDGSAVGDREGRQKGYADGIDTGEREGRRRGTDEGDTAGRQSGYRDGYGVDQSAGTQKGNADGQNVGTTSGTQAGQKRCYDEGYTGGYNSAFATAKQLGLQDAASYNAGYAKGATDASVIERLRTGRRQAIRPVSASVRPNFRTLPLIPGASSQKAPLPGA